MILAIFPGGTIFKEGALLEKTKGRKRRRSDSDGRGFSTQFFPRVYSWPGPQEEKERVGVGDREGLVLRGAY